MVKPDFRQKLEDKGWETEDIDKAISVFEEDKEKRNDIITKLDRLVYWVAMIVAIAGNFIISIILIPFLVSITNKVALYIIIFAISLSFGFLFNILLKDIEEIDYDHHLIAGVFIPTLALINIFVITNVANHFLILFKIQTSHNPIIVGAIYVAAFVSPYAADKLFKYEKDKRNLMRKSPAKEE
jgi:hypothetical protein